MEGVVMAVVAMVAATVEVMEAVVMVAAMAECQRHRQHSSARRIAPLHLDSCRCADSGREPRRAALERCRDRTPPTSRPADRQDRTQCTSRPSVHLACTFAHHTAGKQ